jgi:hypothetical protein
MPEFQRFGARRHLNGSRRHTPYRFKIERVMIGAMIQTTDNARGAFAAGAKQQKEIA